MNFELTNRLYLSGMKPETLRAIKTRVTIKNPAYIEAEKMGRYTRDIEPELKFYEETEEELICPRGVATQIYKICQNQDEDIKVIDNRRTLDSVTFTFNGDIRLLQQPAVENVLKHDFGLLEAPTGSGKTAMALYMIAERQQPALIVVHTKELLNQWIDRIEQFLMIPRDEIGIVGSGKFIIGKKITVAMIQTCQKTPRENLRMLKVGIAVLCRIGC